MIVRNSLFVCTQAHRNPLHDQYCSALNSPKDYATPDPPKEVFYGKPSLSSNRSNAKVAPNIWRNIKARVPQMETMLAALKELPGLMTTTDGLEELSKTIVSFRQGCVTTANSPC
jgi:hypothetical protein